MNGVSLAFMILTNIAIAGLGSSILLAPAPDFGNVVASEPMSKHSSITESGQTIDEIQNAPDGSQMFGTSGVPEKKKAEELSSPPSQPSSDEIVLLGILIVQNGVDQQSVVALLKHGRPPVVSRHNIGDVINDWSLVSVTRNTARLIKPDGKVRILQIEAKN